MNSARRGGSHGGRGARALARTREQTSASTRIFRWDLTSSRTSSALPSFFFHLVVRKGADFLLCNLLLAPPRLLEGNDKHVDEEADI